MKIEVGDIIKYKGERREVLSIHPDYGMDIGNMQRVTPDEVEEVYSQPVSDDPTPGPWVWVFMGNAGNYYLVGNDGRGPAVRSGPKSADGQLMASAPALAAEVARLNNLVLHLSDVIADEQKKSQNRKEVNGLLSRQNKKLEAEVARLKAQVRALKKAAQMAYEDLEQYEYIDLPGGYQNGDRQGG